MIRIRAFCIFFIIIIYTSFIYEIFRTLNFELMADIISAPLYQRNIVDSSTFAIANVNKMFIRFVLYAKTYNIAI